MPLEKAARIFGTRENLYSAALSPDGKKVVLVGSVGARTRLVYVVDLADSQPHPILHSDDNLKLTHCGWAGNDRLVCGFRGLDIAYGQRLGFSRLLSLDPDGKNIKDLTAHTVGEALRISQFTGGIIDWLDGSTPDVLMVRDHVPGFSTGQRGASTRDGYGVDQVNTRSLSVRTIEGADKLADTFITDGQGHVRIMSVRGVANDGMLRGWWDYRYRLAGEERWRPFSHVVLNAKESLRPLAVDGNANVAYALKSLNGRDALYRVRLDETLTSELVYGDPVVDVDDIVTIGRHGRVIGVSYATDRRVVDYFDPDYKTLAAKLSKALPKLPLVSFESASADESVLLLRASSDTDGGHMFLYQKASRHLTELMPVRPELDGVATATVRSISYPAGDGAMVPAYLTLPPDGADKNLPAIVMPHGGPAARDEWGFDWLAQFFAARGYAVIQPQFRGSTGFGDAWYVDNGFKSWKIAVRDVTAAGEWLVKQGIADPAKLAIVGWSYGGYAALQSNVLDPGLFKAVVAIAPVTDLNKVKLEAAGFTNAGIVRAYVGDGPHITEGSPALHADRFRAPVLMFHGDQDINVGIGQSAGMDAALKRAGKVSNLVRYPGLDHQLDDSSARIDMLTKADTFLRDSMGM
ncbi:S9 family peptidase [Sphingomonas sp. AP4-R1]|nr:S9 family peptidase [Sphingomonas sp. AP4-R1]